MATTKKPTTRRNATTTKRTTAPRKNSPKTKSTAARSKAKTTSAPKTAAKRPATKKPSTSRAKAPQSMRSFHRADSTEPFMSFKVTVQTIYWVILGASVIGLALWVLTLHNRIQSIYDEIDKAQVVQMELDAKELSMLKERAIHSN